MLKKNEFGKVQVLCSGFFFAIRVCLRESDQGDDGKSQFCIYGLTETLYIDLIYDCQSKCKAE